MEIPVLRETLDEKWRRLCARGVTVCLYFHGSAAGGLNGQLPAIQPIMPQESTCVFLEVVVRPPGLQTLTTVWGEAQNETHWASSFSCNLRSSDGTAYGARDPHTHNGPIKPTIQKTNQAHPTKDQSGPPAEGQSLPSPTPPLRSLGSSFYGKYRNMR
jgi:hypothetical protein